MIEVYVQIAEDNARKAEFGTLDEAQYYANFVFNDRPSVYSTTIINGEVVQTQRRLFFAGGNNIMHTHSKLDVGTPVLWKDTEGITHGRIAAGGATRTRNGDVGYHVFDDKGDWFVIPVWAIVPSPTFPGPSKIGG